MNELTSPPVESVVTRWVRRPTDAIEDRLGRVGSDVALDGHAHLVVTRPFARRDVGGVAVWEAEGRLVGHRLGRGSRVELDVSPWSDDTTEVSVRPRGWSRTRPAAYYDLAHAAASRLTELLAPA